ncbi:MAG: hypothetical protein U0935_20225 [Pirellulales bacterium]
MQRPPKITVDSLREQVHSAEPAAHLVEARILRRVVRLDRRLPGFGLSLLQRKSYTIERDRLLSFVDRHELELNPGVDLTRIVILLARPGDETFPDQELDDTIRQRYHRLLFHECVRVELLRRIIDVPSQAAWAEMRRRELGETEFAEAQAVLLKDERLFPSPTDLETYIEFAAVYLELRYFSPADPPLYFPAIRDWDEVARIVSQDVDHAGLFERLRGTALGAPPAAAPGESESWEAQAGQGTESPRFSLADFRWVQAQAEQAAALGNGIKAALTHTRAALAGPPEFAGEAHEAARMELLGVAQRFQRALDLPDEEADIWHAALVPLLIPAARGFWSNEARLLHDLQKVCIEQERGIYRLDLVEWIRTLGARPIRRPLPLLRDALVVKHLRTAGRRVATARIRPADRERLAGLLDAVLARVEEQSRDHLRPVITDVFNRVGFEARNVPEQVARRKIVEELLDGVVEHSYISMANLRDALSKNDLKLPDVATVSDVVLGDKLLRADRLLDRRLDGVYRRAAVYQRWPQSMSSIIFGTNFGRQLTMYAALPYGGAYLGLEFLRHLTAGLFGTRSAAPAPADAGVTASLPQVEGASRAGWLFYAIVVLLGTWIALLMHRPEFRAWCLTQLRRGWRLVRQVVIELPSRLVHSRFVRRILDSAAYAGVRNYALRPGLTTAVLGLSGVLAGYPVSRRLAFELFLIVNLFLNSPGGRYVTEVTADFMVRLWHELTVRVFANLYQWTMAIFQGLLVALERVVYMVDEWLLFRRGDHRGLQVAKALGGVLWFFVAYLVVFVFTLLVEPQINPIKHFPVVTVSHKLILPTGPLFVKHMTPYLGQVQANTLVWTTIWLIPGVFGFLVWELKENWRLYAANRSRVLRPTVIGRHGETMVRLLRPGFHSGTLSKAFAALRRAARKEDGTLHPHRVTVKRVAVEQVEDAVRRFVERELLFLLEEGGFQRDAVLRVAAVRAATNRIDVELAHGGFPGENALLTWEERGGKLCGQLERSGWMTRLSAPDQTTLATALQGLFRRAGVEQTAGPFSLAGTATLQWDNWVAFWTLTATLHASESAGSESSPEPAS